MNIGVLTHNYPKNHDERKNAGIFIYDFVKELSKKHETYILNFESLDKNKLGQWKLFNPIDIFRFFKLMFRGSKKSVAFVRDNNLNFIFAFWALPSGLFAYILNVFYKTPYAIWCLGSDLNKYARYPILRQLIILSLRNADYIFANSDDLVKKIYELVDKKAIFLPAVTRFKISRQKRVVRKNAIFKFLFVGRLEKVKGPDILIQAVNRLNFKGIKNFSVDILGGGSMEKELKSDKVCLHGWADESTVQKFMSDSDCLVVPSRSESLPLVMLEAASSNLPVIASNVGDCSFLIKKYNIGYSFEKEDADGLANAMVTAIKEGSSKRTLRKFQKMSEDFSLENSVNEFLSRIS